MNFELGWRDVGIPLFAIAQHFSLFTFHFSFPTGKTFHFHKRESPYITPIQCSTYGARMAVKMPLRVRPSDA